MTIPLHFTLALLHATALLCNILYCTVLHYTTFCRTGPPLSPPVGERLRPKHRTWSPETLVGAEPDTSVNLHYRSVETRPRKLSSLPLRQSIHFIQSGQLFIHILLIKSRQLNIQNKWHAVIGTIVPFIINKGQQIVIFLIYNSILIFTNRPPAG